LKSYLKTIDHQIRAANAFFNLVAIALLETNFIGAGHIAKTTVRGHQVGKKKTASLVSNGAAINITGLIDGG
jgi:hypothetical protein